MLMKKVYIAILALAGLFATSCVQEHIDAQFFPENVTDQTLGTIAGTELSEAGPDITTTYTEVDFGLSVPTSYTLWMDLSGNNFANAKKVDATISDGNISFAQKKFNKTLLNLGVTPDTDVAVDFRLDAYMQNEKLSNIEEYARQSNVVTATFHVYEEIKGDLPVVDVPGDYQGWAPSDYPKLFSYSYDEIIYRGVVDFQCKKEDGSAANGFKITGGGNWDNDSGNWGSAAQGEAAEAGSVQLVNGDGSQNIVCYGANRYYLFEFNKDALTLTKIMSFDKVGIIGLNGDWDNDVVMTYNMYMGRFWADVDLAADTEFKFRLDGGWDNNWGGDLEALQGGGANIPVAAGQYRVYFYMNDVTLYCELDPSMYGKDEPTIDEPDEPDPAYEGWGIIGVGGDWENDIAMTQDGGVWTGYATLTAEDTWKLRKDAAWDENFGGIFSALDTPFAAVAGGDNIAVGAEGFYKIVLNTNDNTITISNGEVWSLIGNFNEWAGDTDMVLTDGKWVSPAVNLTAGWKLRHNHSWDDNRGGVFEALDTPFAVTNGGADIDCGEGEFIVTYDPAAETITVTKAFPSNIWSVIGGFEASGWNNDVKMTLLEGAYKLWVSDPVELKAGDEFKVRYNRDWGVNRGAEATLEYGNIAQVSQDGANLKAAEDGTYIIVYSEELECIFFQGWSVIGQISGSNWDKDFPMAPVYDEEEGRCLGWMSDVLNNNEGDQFKIRYNAGWDINRGGAFSEFAENFPVTLNGDNISAPGCKYIFVTYSVDDDSIYVGRADWSIIGGFNEWNGDVVMFETQKGIYERSLTLSEASEIKIRKDRAWDVDRGGDMSALGEAFDAVQGGHNISLEAGTYYISYDSVNEKLTIEKE